MHQLMCTSQGVVSMSSSPWMTMTSEGIWPPGIKNEVLEWVELNREELMKEWKKWHK